MEFSFIPAWFFWFGVVGGLGIVGGLVLFGFIGIIGAWFFPAYLVGAWGYLCLALLEGLALSKRGRYGRNFK